MNSSVQKSFRQPCCPFADFFDYHFARFKRKACFFADIRQFLHARICAVAVDGRRMFSPIGGAAGEVVGGRNVPVILSCIVNEGEILRQCLPEIKPKQPAK